MMGPMDEETKDKLEEILSELDGHDQVTVNDDGSKTIRLSEPVQQTKDKVVSEVTFRAKIKGFDYREMGKGKNETEQSFYLAASLSGLPLKVFDNMDGDDALLCCQVAGSMLAAGKK